MTFCSPSAELRSAVMRSFAAVGANGLEPLSSYYRAACTSKSFTDCELSGPKAPPRSSRILDFANRVGSSGWVAAWTTVGQICHSSVVLISWILLPVSLVLRCKKDRVPQTKNYKNSSRLNK
jgi:hypothetical protein